MSSDNSVPTFSKLIVPIIDVLKELGGAGTNKQIVDGLLARGFNHGIQRGNRSELEYRSAWARTYLKAYGGLNNPEKGIWQLNDKGRSITDEKVSEIVNLVAKRSRDNKKAKKKAKAKSNGRTNTVSKRKVNSVRSDISLASEVAPVDQVRTIISLLENGILTKASANEAIRKLGGI